MGRPAPDGRRPTARRAVHVVAAIAAIAVVGILLVLGSASSWHTQIVADVPISGGGIRPLTERGDSSCTGVAEIPSSAGRAEFRITGDERVRARVDVAGEGRRSLAGPAQSVRRNADGVVRLRLPAGASTSDASFVCLVSEQRAPFGVRGDGAAAVRLVGAEPQSRLSQLGSELSRAGRAKGTPFHAIGGWLALALTLAALGGGLALAARAWGRDDAWRPGRRTWLAVAAVGVLHAWAWAAITPPYQVPDEVAHAQYASYIADHGALPTGEAEGGAYSDAQNAATDAINFGGVVFRPDLRPPWSERIDDGIGAQLEDASNDVPDGNTTATSQPPLYYVSVAAGALGGGNALDALARMRILSALWLGVAALGAMALLREVAPTRPRWMVTGGLAVALFPLLGFLAGGVTPDVAMTALAFWLFVFAARAWRLGTSRRTTVLFGLMLVALVLTKLTAAAVVPGAVAILLAAAVRDWRASGRVVPWRDLLVAGGIVLAPVVLFLLANVASGRPLVPGAVGGLASTSVAAGQGPPEGLTGNFREILVVTWQLFFPRLPMMQDFLGGFPFWDVWMQGLVGRFGWLDYGFSTDVRRIVVAVWAVVAGLGVWGLVALFRRHGWRAAFVRYGPLVLGGLVAVAGLMLVIGRVDYNSRFTNGPPFQQARYLLPALPVAIVVLALGLRGAGRRVAPYLGVLLVAGAALWVLAAFSITLTRYYG